MYGLEFCQNDASGRTAKGMVNWNLTEGKSQHIGCMVRMCKNMEYIKAYLRLYLNEETHMKILMYR